jgi:PAS domain S-box-containing protein
MEGDLSQSVTPSGYGESLNLSESFEEMRKRLQQSFTEIRRNTVELETLLESQRRTGDQLVASQNRFDQLAEQSRTIIWELDSDATFVSVSPVVERILGYRVDDLLGKKHYYDLMSSADTSSAKVRFLRMVESETQLGSDEKALVAADGHLVWLIGRSLPLRDGEGNIQGYYGSDTDISERKKAEEENEKLQMQLNQAQKMESVGRLAGGVAHDFNNMLGVIIGHAELALLKIAPDAPFQGNLEEIKKAAERSAELTRQLLAFARKQTVAPKVLDLNETMEKALKMLRRLIGEDIDLAWLPGSNLEPIFIDSSQVDQILTNLCVNARDAIAGAGKITIETNNVVLDAEYCARHTGFLPGEYVLLAVSDNGCGMDEVTLSHIFEPFFTTKKMGKGTGLGLAMVYGAVKQNNGFINVYSEPSHGTTFKIYLPRHTATVASRHEPGQVPKPMTGSETILLVEDEPAVLMMTSQQLEKMGYAVIVAGNPGEAIRLAREHQGQIDLLITDVVMPEMNGRELAENLLSRDPNLKRLYISGYTANVIAHHGVLDQGVHFIQKPFSMKDLGEKLRRALEG